MTTLIERVKRAFGAIERAPVERKVADMLARGGVIDDKFPTRVSGQTFDAGINYFGVRLSGLHMVDARRFATEQLPMCVCLAEFENGGQRRTIPFSVGPDAIRQKLKDAGVDGGKPPKPAWVELKDLTVVRPTPVNVANLSLYTGLFSVPANDLVKTLLNVVGTVGTALGQPSVGAGLKVAETVYDSFGSMLALDQVTQVAAALIGSVLTETGSGYLLIANVDGQVFDPQKGRVVSGRLCWSEDKYGGKPVTEFDHALLALERYETIIEKATGLAPVLFEVPWAAVRMAQSREEADKALDKLRDAISASPDVTEDDRIALLGGYSSVAEKLATARWPKKADEAAVRRGTAEIATGWIDNLSDSASKIESDQPKLAKSVRAAFATLSKHKVGEIEINGAGPFYIEDETAILGAAQAVRKTLLKGKENNTDIGPILSRAAAGR